LERGWMERENPVSLKDYAAYIFDLDGTLFAIPVDWLKVREEVSKMAGAPIGDAPLFLKVQQLISIRPSMRESLFEMLDRHELKAVAGASPVSGAIELLSHLSKVAKLGLVTMQGTAVCDNVLGTYHLGELFDVLVTREDSLDRVTQLRSAMRSLAELPRNTLFTGDRANDIVCGKKVGVGTVLVGREPTDEIKPDYAFPALDVLRGNLI